MCQYYRGINYIPSYCLACQYYLWLNSQNYVINRDQCTAVCPQKFASGGYCGKWCILTQGHYGPHICPDGHQWY